MMITRFRGAFVALGLLAAPLPLMLSCGGNLTAPPAKYSPAPVVVISGTTTTAASGPVTLTFTFSQPMSSFSASAVSVTNGTAAATTTRLSANQYTLVVTPQANATGTMTIGVPANAFADSAGVANTAPAVPAQQAFDTVVPATSYVVEDFNSALPSGEAYLTTDFGNESSTITSTGVPSGIPAGSGPVVVKTTKPGVAATQTWAGTTLSVGYLGSIGTLPFSATATKMTVVFYAPAAGLDTKLKVEDANDATHSCETDVLTSAAGWQTLSFDFSSQASGTPALNLAYTYNKVSIFPHFGTVPAADETYYVGAVTFLGASAPAAPPLSSGPTSYAILDFNTALPTGQAYLTTDFGNEASSITSTGVPSGIPAGSGPIVVKTTKPGVGATQIWAGTTLSVGYLDSIGQLPFSATATKATVVLYAPAAGKDIKLKVEDATNGSDSVETDVLTTAAGWQTLTFDFSSQASGTAPLNLAYTYDKISIFPDYGVVPGADETYYVGTITFLGASGPAAPPLTQPSLAKPTTAAPTPSQAAASVVALYNSSAKYTDVPNDDNYHASWSSVGNVTTYAIPSTTSTVLEYDALQYVGIEFLNPGPHVNAGGKTTMHVDLWTPNATTFAVQLVSWNAGGTAATGNYTVPFTSTTIKQNQWVSLDIPLSSFSGNGVDLTNIGQMLFQDNIPNPEGGTFYIDNVYFY